MTSAPAPGGAVAGEAPPVSGVRPDNGAASARRALLPTTVNVRVEPAAVTGLAAVATVSSGLALALPVPILLASVLGVLVVCSHDGRHRDRAGLLRAGQLLRDLAVAFAAVVLASSAGPLPAAAPDTVAAALAAGGAVMLGATVLRRRGRRPLRVVVVGDRAAVGAGATRWAGSPRVRVVGALLNDQNQGHDGPLHDGPVLDDTLGVPTVHGLDDAATWAARWRADLVAVSSASDLTADDVRRLGWQLERTPVDLAVTGLLDPVAPHRVESVSVDGLTFQRVRPARRTWPVRATKAAVDRVLGAVLLAVAAPVLAALVVAVRLDSPGPGLFRQIRVGRDGRPFRIVKLRTMTTDAEVVRAGLADRDEGAGHLFKIRSDPRVTRLGRVLRATSLDELPQLLNVVRGEMSLVGPRPALPEEVARYSATERRRLAVRPGMTGLWQVSGRSDLSWEDSVALDLHYTDNGRLGDDLVIGVRTVEAVIRGAGAY